MIHEGGEARCSAIRDYTSADGKAVLSLWYSVFRQSFPYLQMMPKEEQFCLYFEKVMTQQQRIWVAVDGETIVGFVSATCEEIRNLFVDRYHQRRGIGTALLKTAMKAFPEIRLVSTIATNLAARHFYERNGFLLWRTEPHTFAGQRASIYRRTGNEGADGEGEATGTPE